MKKSRPVLFPEFIGSENMTTEVDDRWKDIRPDCKLKIGKPSNRYYQYIFPSLNFKQHSLENLNELLELEGVEVCVRSVLKMKNGESYAVLRKTEEGVFPGNLDTIYAEIEKSFVAHEILDL